MYTKEEEIIHFVFLAFNNMKRKKEDINLAFHSIIVGTMLKNIGCDEKIIFMGYLHDIIEDTKYTYDDLLKICDKNVADGVLKLTEDKSINNWKERKLKFIENIKSTNKDVLLVELADKLHNLVSDYKLFLKNGNISLLTECDNYQDLKWYYIELQKIFNSKLDNNILLKRYNEIIKIYFN